jgi:hypothetical protein
MVEAGDRGDMLVALDTLGISHNAFRLWLKSGVVPEEWRWGKAAEVIIASSAPRSHPGRSQLSPRLNAGREGLRRAGGRAAADYPRSAQRAELFRSALLLLLLPLFLLLLLLRIHHIISTMIPARERIV